MEDNLIYVVGTAFIKDGKLLVSMSHRSSLSGKYTLVGGGVEKGETFKEAACREIREEIANGFTISEDDLQEIVCFREPALSDPERNIEMHMYLSLKDVNVPLKGNEEIIGYKWYSLDEDGSILSSAIKYHLIPWAIENKKMY
jgi:8-oxo-dGTP pyrophosphatase MutT (NUDIX family)